MKIVGLALPISSSWANLDTTEPPDATFGPFQDRTSVRASAGRYVAESEGAIKAAYCRDTIAAAETAACTPTVVFVFHDCDTPPVVDSLREQLGARQAAPFGGRADPLLRRRTESIPVQG